MFDKRAYVRAYQLTHRNRLNRLRKASYYRNRTETLEKMRIYRVRNRERLSVLRKQKYLENPLPARSRRARYYAKNRDKVLAQIKKYRSKNPGVIVKANAIRRSRQFGTGTSKEQLRGADKKVRFLRAQKNLRCRYCHKKLARARLHIDHITPLSRGGRHCAENITAACSRCNLSKNNKIFGPEWTPKIRFR